MLLLFLMSIVPCIIITRIIKLKVVVVIYVENEDEERGVDES